MPARNTSLPAWARMVVCRIALVFCLLAVLSSKLLAFELNGEPVQGGLLFGQAAPGSTVLLDGQPLPLSAEGHFVVGFGRDATGSVVLSVREPGQAESQRTLTIEARKFAIEHVDGLPQATVTPPPEAQERIRREAALVNAAKSRRDDRADFAAGFRWPAQGRLSGFYGSQRVLNGQPGNPHWGVDVAAPEGTLVVAPAAGLISLAESDLYFSGGTVILDHGLGLNSSFLHLSEVLVSAGQIVRAGDAIGRVGMTGRATGPHLDWRMSWQDVRVDPQLLVGVMPEGSR